MNTQKVQLLISDKDQKALYALIGSRNSDTFAPLEEELSRAQVLPESDLPGDVVTLNSTVRVQDTDSGQESEMQLVLPHEANINENKISVLVPMGMALIGLRAGQTYEWVMPGGKTKHFKVISARR